MCNIINHAVGYICAQEICEMAVDANIKYINITLLIIICYYTPYNIHSFIDCLCKYIFLDIILIKDIVHLEDWFFNLFFNE